MSIRESLSSFRVVDLGVGMACALLSKLLVEAGASVVRIEPQGGDPFYEVYPAYRYWQTAKAIRSVDDAQLAAELDEADLCLVGGEDYPELAWHHDPVELSARFPRLVVVDIAGYAAPLEGDPSEAVDLLVQATSGLVWEQKIDRPLFHTLPDPSYGAALQGLIGGLAALWERQQSGLGQVVSTSLQQATLMWRAMHWFDSTGVAPHDRLNIPKGARQLICRCADGAYVHFTKGGRGATLRVNELLGIHDPTVTSETPSLNLADGPNYFFGDLDLIAGHVANWESNALLEGFQQNGITAERVLAPGECWEDAQVLHNGIIVSAADGASYVGFPFSATSAARLPSDQSPKRQNEPSGRPPLAGIKILDLGSYVAGPSASRILGDLGADVVKLEPMTGDPARILLPTFAMANRGKQAITVDLKTPEGAMILRRLCLECDIVHHNFRADIARRLGVDAASLRELKQDTIVLETTGYGVSGPNALRPGVDMVMQAFCGHEYRFGGTENRPEWNRFANVDTAAGMLGAIALLMALLRRRDGHEALALDVSLLNAGIFLLSELVRSPDGSFAGAPLNNATQTGTHPAEQLYQTKDGWIAVAARTEDMAARLVQAVDLGSVIRRPRSEWEETEASLLADTIRLRTTRDLVDALTVVNVWVAECRPEPEQALLRDMGLMQAGAVIVTDDGVLQETRQVGAGFRLSRSPLSTVEKSHIPALGEDTKAVLSSLGYTADEIADLYQRRVVA